MGNRAPTTATTADVRTLSGLDTADLSRLHKTGILEPTKAGKQGNVSREYDTPHTVASMAVGDFRRRLGIVNRQQLAPIVQAIDRVEALRGRAVDEDMVEIDFDAVPRWVVFTGAKAYTTNEFPTDPVCIVVGLQSYVARLILRTQFLPSNVFHRLRAVLLVGSADGGGALEREASQFGLAILNGAIPLAEASRLLGVREVILQGEILEITATAAEDPEQRQAAAEELRRYVASHLITNDAQWTSGLGEAMAAAWSVKL